MDVHCPQCDTLFEFDERQMRGAIATLKCSVCQHLFRIETNISLGRGDHRRWMVRNTASGDVMYFSGFDVLHRWIMEGELQRVDEISRTGAKWVKLEDIGEFTPVFEVVDSIQSLTRGNANAATDDPRTRNQTMQQFASPQAQPLLRSPSRQPAPSWAGGQTTHPQDSKEAHSLHLPPSPHGAALSISPLSAADSAPSFSPSVRLPPQQAPAREPQRTRTPQSLKAQTSSAVSVDASAATASPDTWALHSEPELYRVDTPATSSAGGFNLVKAVLVLFVVCLIGVVGFRFAAPEQFKAIFGGESTTESEQPLAVKDAVLEPVAEEPSPDKANDAVRAELDAAYEASFGARDAWTGERITAGIVAAMSPVHGAIDEAKDRSSTKIKKGSSRAGQLKEAQSALDSGDSQRAYDLYYKVLDRDARNAKALTGLGWTLIQMGRHESAAVQFKRAMSIDSGLVSAYLGLAKAERNKGNAKGAIRIYDEFLKRFPSARQANIARTQRDKLLKEIGQ